MTSFKRLKEASLLILFVQVLYAQSAVVKEVFFTTEQPRENIDSPAIWHGPHGEHLLFATSKEGHSVNVFDAVNGAMIQRLGGLGIELGQFNRPNGVWVIDDLLFVVERDNQRVQALLLPQMRPLATFGEEHLGKPYGLYVQKMEAGLYHIYVTDSYESKLGEIPADHALNKRIHLFTFEIEGTTAEGEWMKAFGATSGEGRLFVVESIFGDPAYNRILVAEELEDAELGRRIKIYDFQGNYTGVSLGAGQFKAQVEGIALYPTSDTDGYWIITDQSKIENVFHVFDRSSLEHLGSFKGERTLNTDGVWVTTTPMPRFPKGAFYACDNDRAISAFDIVEIFKALSLKP